MDNLMLGWLAAMEDARSQETSSQEAIEQPSAQEDLKGGSAYNAFF